MNNNPEKKPLLTVSDSPHIKSPITTKTIMGEVIFALLPALLWSAYVFGFRTIVITAISVISCILFETIFSLIAKRRIPISDHSAAVTGILLALTLPVSVSLWIPVIGSFFAIVIVKQLYGGIGKNIVNPALAARVFLRLAFPAKLTTFTLPFHYFPPFKMNVNIEALDAVSGATPLSYLKNGNLPSDDLINTFFGSVPGSLGEISASLLIIGGIYLIYKRVITWQIPTSFVLTVAVVTFLFSPEYVSPMTFMLYHLFSGGLILGAFFMATDYTTSPVTKKARLIYGICCGLLTVFLRFFDAYPEGVAVAILVMNLLTPTLDKLTVPRPYGCPKHKNNIQKIKNILSKLLDKCKKELSKVKSQKAGGKKQ